jgi:hypothetical protein
VKEKFDYTQGVIGDRKLKDRPQNDKKIAQKTIYKILNIKFLIRGENTSTQIKPPICRKSRTNFITYSCIEYTSPSAGFELTNLVVIGTASQCLK